MSLVALGTPGGLTEISSIALHIGSMWPRPVTVVEADPDGGRLAARHNWRIRPGLGALAASLRQMHGTNSDSGAASYGADLKVVAAPASPEEVISVIPYLSDSARRIDEVLGTDVLVSVGTIRPGSPASALIESADARLLVMRCTIDDVSAVVHRRKLLQAIGTWTVLTAGGALTTVDISRVIHWPVLADLLPSDRRNTIILRRRIGEFAANLRSLDPPHHQLGCR